MTNKPTWKEELDQLIDRNYPSVRSYTAGKFHSMIKDFISTKLAEQRKEIIEKIEKEKQNHDGYGKTYLEEIINLIKQD